MIPSHEAFVGMLCSWMHVPRGGYGYAIPVDAKIVALSLDGSLATIEVQTRRGARVKRQVKTSQLRSGLRCRR